jgi:hypothetical protein
MQKEATTHPQSRDDSFLVEHHVLARPITILL